MNEPFGVARWSGTFDGDPAFATGYYGGANLYCFRDGRWEKVLKSESYDELSKRLGILATTNKRWEE